LDLAKKVMVTGLKPKKRGKKKALKGKKKGNKTKKKVAYDDSDPDVIDAEMREQLLRLFEKTGTRIDGRVKSNINKLFTDLSNKLMLGVNLMPDDPDAQS
jgi:hypothetical protein